MNDRQRIVLTRLVTGSLLFLLTLRLLEHATLSGLGTPPLFTVDLDLTYWIYKDSGVPDWLMQHHAAAVTFDICLFGSGLLAFFFPLRRAVILVFALLLFLYSMTFLLFVVDHMGQLNGFMLVLLPFLVAGNVRFTLAWEGMRYLTCLIYFLAFCWKTMWGDSFYYLHQGVSTFKYNLVDYLSLNPGTTMTAVYEWFLRHPWLLNTGEKSLVLVEGIMVVGLFTKRYDRWLIWGPVLIHGLTYFFSDVFYIELLVIDLSFLSIATLDRLAPFLSFGAAPGRIKKENILR
jgi:hypothetical protein